MPDITIRSIPQELIDKINSLAALSKHSDRSAFLVAALQDYCMFSDQYFMHRLPDVTYVLMEDAMKREAKKNEELLTYALSTIKASNKLMQQLFELLSGEIEPELDDNTDDLPNS